MASTAHIHKLTIQRFRGVQSLSWLPAEGMNIILGGSDVSKTTVLEAIADRAAAESQQRNDRCKSWIVGEGHAALGEFLRHPSEHWID